MTVVDLAEQLASIRARRDLSQRQASDARARADLARAKESEALAVLRDQYGCQSIEEAEELRTKLTDKLLAEIAAVESALEALP